MGNRVISFPKRGNPIKIRKTRITLELPFSFADGETGDRIRLSVSPQYFTLAVNRREYYFVRETGRFDGTASLELDGPIMIFGSSADDE